jgi:hypothetical protein
MKKLIIAILLIAAAVVTGTVALAAREDVRVAGMFQTADSAHYIIRWVPGQIKAPRQAPIDQWHVRILSPTDTVAYGVAVGGDHRDTLALAWSTTVPDSLGPLNALVSAVDSRGLQGPWGSSDAFWHHTTALPPDAPDSVIVDSSMVVAAIYILPDSVEILVGETFQFCAVAEMLDGSTGLASPNDTMQVCQDRYADWLSLRFAGIEPRRQSIIRIVADK